MNSKPTPTFRYGSKFVALLMILSLVLSSVPSGVAAPLPPEGGPFETIDLPPGAEAAPEGLMAKSRALDNPKLDTTMADLAAAARDSTQEAIALARSQSLDLSDNRVHVQIVTHASGLENAIKTMTSAGGEVTGVGNNDTLIQGWLLVDALETVAAQDDVYLIRRPAALQLFETLRVGNSTTEALAVINGPAWHTAGYTGSGVKVAIIDGGFIGYDDLLGVDLPATVTVKNFVDGEDDSQVDGTTPHGTACAEIIHDIVPDATLYLAKTSTNVDLAEAVAWAKDTHGVDVISTSLGWYNLTAGDGTGEFADLVQSIRNAGILWVTAAGNDREAHWGGLYSDPNANDVHNFDGDQEINYFGPGDGNPYAIPAGVPLMAFLRWDDWTNVDQDYDLRLLRWSGSGWDTIAASEDTQNGGAGQTPTEFAYAVSSGADTAYGFVILRSNSTRNVNFEVFVPKVARLDELLYARSLANLADAPDAMTVAALDVTSPYPQESYSSEGPTNGPGGAETGGFTKPDISGFANVATESYTDSTFNGTSAATPHVAGAAALVLSAYPSYTPDQLQSFLEDRAVDKGSAGMDTLYGYGQLYLGDPPAGANTAPTLSGLPDQTLFANTSLDNAIELWDYAADAEDADADLTFSIVNTPDPDAGVSIDADGHHIDINPTADWTGTTDVEIQVQDTGDLSDTDTFRVTVSPSIDKTWDGSVDSDWHTADNWTPTGVPDANDDVLIPDVANDPIISTGDAQVGGLTVEQGAVLDLTERALTVEGVLTNNGTLKQTQNVVQGDSTEFLRITNLAGDQTKYYGVDMTPTGTASVMFDLAVKQLPIPSEPLASHSLKGENLVKPAAPLADVELVLDDGTQESNIVLRDPDTLTEYHAVLFNHYTSTMVSSFPFTLERIDIHQNTNNLQGEEIQLLVYTDADGGDPSNATLRYSEIVTVQTQLGWNVYTLTTPVVISNTADILVGFSTYYADGGVSWPEDRHPYPMDETDPQGMSYAAYMYDTADPVDPSDLSSFYYLIEMSDVGYPCNWMIRGYGSLGATETAPTLSGLPNQTVPMNGSADNAIDLWAYADDTEDADADLTFTIVNTPDASAGVSIDAGRYIDINPATDWTGQTDVQVQVQDTGGLTGTDTFQVTVTDSGPDIAISPASLEAVVHVDGTVTQTLSISNAGGDALVFSISDDATWLSEDPSSGTVPVGNSVDVDTIFDATGLVTGVYTADLTIDNNDPDKNPLTVPITMHVTDNMPPVLSGIPDQTVVSGSAYTPLDLWLYASDQESSDDQLTFAIDNIPDPNAGVSIDSDRYVNIDPAPGWTGQTTVVVRVTDPVGLSDTDTFLVTVNGGLADVTVSVSGNQFCADRSTGVERCFDIDASAPLSATVRFYFDEDERNGHSLSNLWVFHNEGGEWIKEPGPCTSGGAGDAQYVEAQNVDDFSFFALGRSGPSFVYFPLVLRRWPPVPNTPVLHAINNADGDGNYTVSWNAAALADTYILQEDSNTSFTNPVTVYDGSDTSTSISGRGQGTYYYRVQALNALASSGWSNTQPAVVTVPLPPCEQHDFGQQGVQYYIYPSGRSWNFTAESDMAVRSVQVKSVLATSAGRTFRIRVKINDETVASWNQYVNNTTYEAFYHSQDVAVDMKQGDKITYYISINSGMGGIAWMNYVKLCR